MPKKPPATERPDVAGSGGLGDDAKRQPWDGLTGPQAKAVEALLQEPTMARAALVAGVSERTLRRWMSEGPFKAAVLAARREAFGQAIALTQKYAPVAVATLVKVMNDASSTASAKVTAAGVLLKFGREGIELDDLAERVEMLERLAKGAGADVATPPHRNGKQRSDDEEAEE